MGHILRIMTQNRSFDIQRLSDALIRRIILLLSGGVLCYQAVMDREDIIGRLRENEAALRARGVAHAALFGSRARGDARPDSDTDIMIEIDPDAPVGGWEYAGIKRYVASLFEGAVDVVDREALKPYVKPTAMSDAIYAF
jgi:uncharacterized protein